MLRNLLYVFIISMLPVIELRGAIPVGVGLSIPYWLNYLVCVTGNILPVPVLIPFCVTVLKWCATWPKIGWIFDKILKKGHGKADQIGNAKFWGLFLFVAIPLPGTGAWTGSLIAAVLQLNKRKSLIAITLGVAASGIIMGILSYGLFGLISLAA